MKKFYFVFLLIILFFNLSIYAENNDTILLSFAGDANNDGVLNEIDIPVLSDKILNKAPASGNTDANNDGKTDIADIVSISNQINTSGTLSVYLPQNVTIKLVKIRKGSFLMGSSEALWSLTTEQPEHYVNINYDFYMGKYEITKSQWNAIMNPGKPFNKYDFTPIENLSWLDCKNFISKINKLNLGTFRLPTESEWEYVCRSDSSLRFSFGNSDCSQNICSTCELSEYSWWCGNNTNFGIKKIGLKKPNNFGIFDMYGNAYEWCEDSWHDNYLNAPGDGSAWLKDNEDYGVVRGGYWDSNAQSCRNSSRYRMLKDSKDEPIGLRIILVK